MSTLPCYFDYAATTPVDDRVIHAMVSCLGRDGTFGNPASNSHAYGTLARQSVELARRQVAELVGCGADDIIWTSGATESNNLAIKGIAQRATGARRHLITSRIEHKAVVDTVRQLELAGFPVTWLDPDAQGLIQPEAVRQALRDDTLLVSLMLVNNELGTLTDIAAIGQSVRERGALFHVDAAQGAGKVAIDLNALPVDLMSFSAHKIYGPKGIGALYVGDRARGMLDAQIHGGGHEQGLRSGTLATHQIVGMGAAYALASAEMQAEVERIGALSDRLRTGLLQLPGVSLNGDARQRIPHTLNLCVAKPGFNALSLASDLAVSSTSACNSAHSGASHVLLAMGLSPELAGSSLRLSLGRYTEVADVEKAIAVISERLNSTSSPFW
ncbi:MULTISPECIES: aminotransferase class V-fold PLP-dependent enzyme [unclassified Pseudomonas]|uniref:aminotransferase class V-fold PLP-dependent enzyme n=1 Tax=unclassified Pseudomonas TaxID=196821 RepID=UPI000D3900A8|nr:MULTISPECIES: aminotransferase class V-fold PLP-dependent enzyme [unclassified Pseudomonas]RAU40335.1 aminotransferase class V-fold PLP-dependent enzyme [Pseudomonas sp. RIT 409]RAU55508.1 aminotransferase class V-fold PLP-dependent enzyme [Pseudomonas sp. RIT 412]